MDDASRCNDGQQPTAEERHATRTNAPQGELLAAFLRARQAAGGEPYPSLQVRLHRLRRLELLLRDNAEALQAAVSGDFGQRSPAETRLLELFPCYLALADARRHLSGWMRPQRRRVALWFQPGRAEVRWQPLGVAGVIVPWNYPIYLAVGPLVGALAAGNRVMVKMSEYTPRTAALFAQLVARHFAADEVSVVQGGAEVAQAFAQLPFDHLLFTGSTPVGRQVMRSAAENLTPVTLELGGKSPAIIGPDVDFARAVERIVVGKTLNAGQTCIAPDYVLLPSGREDEFVAQARRVFAACYPALATTPDYTRIVDARHFARLTALLDDAEKQGAELMSLAPETPADGATRLFPPVLLSRCNDTMRVMHEEIFGPILPMVGYNDLAQAIDYVNARPRPLALYYFARDAASVELVLQQTVSGGVTINDTLLHIAQDDLPFGGVGTSGMGAYHGVAGFRTFSAQKAVFRQARLSGTVCFKAPYGRLFERLMRVLLR